jgi:hypothetical protein
VLADVVDEWRGGRLVPDASLGDTLAKMVAFLIGKIRGRTK